MSRNILDPEYDCPEASFGQHDEGSNRDGTCTYCGKKFRAAAPKPEHFPTTELSYGYARMYVNDEYAPELSTYRYDPWMGY